MCALVWLGGEGKGRMAIPTSEFSFHIRSENLEFGNNNNTTLVLEFISMTEVKAKLLLFRS